MAEQSNSDGRAARPASLWRALAHRNYRLYFAGQGVSLIGTWMTRLATGWLVFRLAQPGPAFLLGLVGFVGQVPIFFLAPFAGALIDRSNRHRLLLVTQALSLIQSALLAVVAFLGEPGTTTITLVVLLSLAQGLINAFDMPARQVFLVEIVERREDLPNAIALNSSMFNGARLIGPSLAGAVIALAGEGWCFTIDAISYLGVIAALLAMRVTPRPPASHHGPLWGGVVEGVRYAFGFAPIRTLFVLLALSSFMGMPYQVLLPLFASDVLHGGAWTLGLLSAAAGLGALAGAFYLASRQTVLGLGRVIAVAATVFGIGLIGFGLSRWLFLSLVLLLLAGFGMMVQMAASNTILQTIAEEDKRGRVMSLFSMAVMGMTPFGSLFAGGLAGAIGHAPLGSQVTVVTGGVACLLGAAVFALRLPQLRPLVRPSYARAGILPEVATGVQAATQLPTEG
jgi:MFS family permease